eukprot:5705357-Pyramimonas_sp.AAC.1
MSPQASTRTRAPGLSRIGFWASAGGGRGVLREVCGDLPARLGPPAAPTTEGAIEADAKERTEGHEKFIMYCKNAQSIKSEDRFHEL